MRITATFEVSVEFDTKNTSVLQAGQEAEHLVVNALSASEDLDGPLTVDLQKVKKGELTWP